MSADSSAACIAGVHKDRLAAFAEAEAKAYARARPKAAEALRNGAGHYLSGVPMHWMADWPMPHLPLVSHAKGSVIQDIDGHRLDDFCLGDTGSMFGHSPAPVAKAIRDQATKGLTYMLPTEAALEAGALLTERFGAFKWQIATTATDANRFALRVARAITNRPKVLVFNGCYHGTVDEAMVTLDQGRTIARPGLMGQFADLSQSAICVEFNDLTAVEAALQTGQIAAILTEPVMTNSCMVLPTPGFHQGLRELTRKYNALLIIDETHTLSSGLGGYTATHGLQPDIFVVGKCVAGGLPTAVWGLTAPTAEAYAKANANRPAGHSGMGTTLSANPLQFAALKANLAEVMTAKAYNHMEKGAKALAAGLSKSIAKHGAPWHVVRVGARVEFICAPGPLTNGSEAAHAHQPQLEAALHTGLINRGSLIAPFHNMMLVSPVTSPAQINRLIRNFDAILTQLFS
ncbi:aspartate aminotransferase family protein [Xinfangfangia sp. CPCC 101601]|uniref:Aspartate aminotransferase family protein n=1 Tax=Pseudogemmobacter lacusdianii TaxID=3069608 RepID=A0ABU0VYM6_9RHOB|nr:aspartate aminotransferase family protein [Xinfangfangia sp. CPCC 101601]MDQ2066000.1 aspartate aminotransferase family protein [Xinfangfangia sp. CPCC 101601]